MKIEASERFIVNIMQCFQRVMWNWAPDDKCKDSRQFPNLS